MKNLLALIIFLSFCNLSAFGQKIFPGNDTSMILGQQLKVMPISKELQTFGYKGFYTDEKLKKIYDEYKYATKYESLVDKVFDVLSIEKYTDLIGDNKYRITIRNSEIGQLYYDYNPRYAHTWNFEFIGDFTLPDNFYCRDITVKGDKFTGDTTYRTPYSGGFAFTKVSKGGKSVIYMSRNIIGSTLNIGEKGAIFLLENNQRIEKPNTPIDVERSKYGSGYIYSAFFELTTSDIKLLLENNITDTRLYIYDDSTKEENAKLIREYLKCLVD